MEFQEVVRRRRMVRAFDDRPVDPDVLDRILDAGNRAPSAGFSQGQAHLVLTEPGDRQRFWEVVSDDADDDPAPDGFDLEAAGAVVVPLACRDVYLDRYAEGDKGWTDRDAARWPVPYWYVDTGMAAENMLLAVVDEGLGALFLGIQAHHWDAFRDAFGIPAPWDPIGAIAIGHPAATRPQPRGSGHTRRRRTLDEVVHRGRW